MKKHLSIFAFAAAAGICAHAAVFTAPAGITLKNGEGKFVPNGAPDGNGYLHFSGGTSGATWEGKVDGTELSVAFWFRRTEESNGSLGLGYGKPPAINIPLAPTEEFGTHTMQGDADRPVTLGEWHHVAYIFSTKDVAFHTYFDGWPQKDSGPGWSKPAPIAKPLTPMGVGFKGDIAGIKIWTTRPSEEELLSFTPSKEIIAECAEKFNAAAAATKHAPLAAWCRAKAEALSAFAAKGKMSVVEWDSFVSAARKLPKLAEFAEKTIGTEAADAPIVPFGIYAYSEYKHLPFTIPPDAKAIDSLRINAARNEFEAATFMAFPLGNVADFDVKPTALKTSAGAEIPASAFDVRTVKVWHTPRGTWSSDRFGGRPIELTPELLLHDDTLIRVDPYRRTNELRIDYPDGARYVDIVRPRDEFDPGIEPVFDAKSFKPVALKDAYMQQFWILLHAPKDAKAGDYKGSLELFAAGKKVGAITLKVRIYPFELPLPRTRYDLTREYQASVFCGAGLSGMVTRFQSLEAAKTRSLNLWRNLVDHGFHQSHGPGGFAYDDPDDYGIMGLQIMQEAGARCRPLLTGSGADGWWANPDNGCTTPKNPEGSPEFWAERATIHRKEVDRIMKAVKRLCGHNDVQFYGYDEADIWGCRWQFPFWNYVKDVGGKIFATSGPVQISYAIDYCDAAARITHTHAKDWHNGGGKVVSYAATFLTAENPYISRRNKGIRMYRANFDGLNDAFWDSFLGNPWNEFIWRQQPYRNFCCVYPTYDDVIDTVAWEGMREAVDDVRYISLMRLAADEAMKSGDPARVKLAKEAIVWFEAQDCEEIKDLDELRERLVEWALKLAPLTSPIFQGEKNIVFNTGLGPEPADPKAKNPCATLRNAEAAWKAKKDPATADALIKALCARSRQVDALEIRKELAKMPNVSKDAQVKAVFDYADALMKWRRRDEAIAQLTQLAEDRATTRQRVAQALLKIGAYWLASTHYADKISAEQIAKAEAAFDKAHNTPGFNESEIYAPLCSLRAAHVSRGDHKKAIEIGREKLLKISQLGKAQEAEVYFEIGVSLRELGQSREAIKHWQRALELGGNKGGEAKKYLKHIGWLAGSIGDYDLAQRALADAITMCNKHDETTEYADVAAALRRYTTAARKNLKSEPDTNIFQGGDDNFGDLDLDEL